MCGDLCRFTSLLPLAWCKIYLRKDKTNVITVSVDGWLTPNLYHQNQQTPVFLLKPTIRYFKPCLDPKYQAAQVVGTGLAWYLLNYPQAIAVWGRKRQSKTSSI